MSAHTGTSAPAPPHPKMEVIVTGDVFHERYLWPNDECELPYTWPDQIRAAKSYQTYRELSGGPLHKEIFELLLAQMLAPGTATFTAIPTADECFALETGLYELAESIASLSAVEDKTTIDDGLKRLESTITNLARKLQTREAGPFPVYLHELGPFPEAPDSSNQVWRIKKSFGHVTSLQDASSIGRHFDDRITELLTKLHGPLVLPTVVVINDRNAGQPSDSIGGSTTGRATTSSRSIFANCIKTLRETNPASSIATKDNLLVIWHTRSPFTSDGSASNPLLDYLATPDLAERTIAIVNYNCLRNSGISLRFDCSYETSISELMRCCKDPPFSKLLLFPHVLIRYDYGIMHVSTKKMNNADPNDHSRCLAGVDIHSINSGRFQVRPDRDGVVTGTTPLLITGILRELGLLLMNGKSIADFLKVTNDVKHPTIANSTILDRAIDVGLILASIRARIGYGPVTSDNAKRAFFAKEVTTAKAYEHMIKDALQAVKTLKDHETAPLPPPPIGPPAGSVQIDPAAPLYSSIEPLSRFSIDPSIFNAANPATVSRLNHLGTKEVFQLGATHEKDREFSQVLYDVVRHGINKVLKRKAHLNTAIEPSVITPVVSAGDAFRSLDAGDIESFLSLRTLVEKYVTTPDWKKPLPFAVFGPPGSGKNTIIKELVGGIHGCTYDRSLDINLSQYDSVGVLSKFFHQIQDATHRGIIPVVVVDEFDSTLAKDKVGWLKYFLMPLQDGIFVSDGHTYHIGRSVIVFAGGVSSTYESFLSEFRWQRSAKVPDFVSRLKGYFNVQGVDLVGETAFKDISDLAVRNDCVLLKNRSTKLRRAIILRGLLKAHMPTIFDSATDEAEVADGVLHAFLAISSFAHGVRSMEAIIQMSKGSTGASGFQPSSLPSAEQLQLHVNAAEFLKASVEPCVKCNW
jgi:hypothetical protein